LVWIWTFADDKSARLKSNSWICLATWFDLA
jgi:hypothetical protein